MTGETIGIIKTKNKTTGEDKFRIGVVQGKNEKEDLEFIRDWGSTLYPEKIKWKNLKNQKQMTL